MVVGRSLKFAAFGVGHENGFVDVSGGSGAAKLGGIAVARIDVAGGPEVMGGIAVGTGHEWRARPVGRQSAEEALVQRGQFSVGGAVGLDGGTGAAVAAVFEPLLLIVFANAGDWAGHGFKCFA